MAFIQISSLLTVEQVDPQEWVVHQEVAQVVELPH
jgi:hypothetical protein